MGWKPTNEKQRARRSERRRKGSGRFKIVKQRIMQEIEAQPKSTGSAISFWDYLSLMGAQQEWLNCQIDYEIKSMREKSGEEKKRLLNASVRAMAQAVTEDISALSPPKVKNNISSFQHHTKPPSPTKLLSRSRRRG